MKCAYKFALACSAKSHVFVPLAILVDTGPPVRRWLIPHAPRNERPLGSVETGILCSLQWDGTPSGLATLFMVYVCVTAATAHSWLTAL